MTEFASLPGLETVAGRTRNNYAVKYLLARSQPSRVSALSEQERHILRSVLNDVPTALTNQQITVLASAIEMGFPVSSAVIGAIYKDMGIKEDARSVTKLINLLQPLPYLSLRTTTDRLTRQYGGIKWTVEALLIALRVNRLQMRVNALVDLLDRLKVEPTNVDQHTITQVATKVKEQGLCRPGSTRIADVVIASAHLGTTINFVQALEITRAIRCAVRQRAPQRDGSRVLTIEEITRIKDCLGTDLATYESVQNACEKLNFPLTARAIRRTARILNQPMREGQKLALSISTFEFLDLMSARTGLQKRVIVDYALRLAAAAMVNERAAVFPPHLALDKLVTRQTIAAQFRLLPPQEQRMSETRVSGNGGVEATKDASAVANKRRSLAR